MLTMDEEFEKWVASRTEYAGPAYATVYNDVRKAFLSGFTIGEQKGRESGEIVAAPVLQPSERFYLAGDPRCESCGHLAVFHFDDMGIETCVITECRCQDKTADLWPK